MPASIEESAARRQPAPTRQPLSGRGLIRRRDLLARLSSAEPGGVVLVCAPAGSGKSILVRSWVHAAGSEARVAWLALERAERDTHRFWASLSGALTRAVGSLNGAASAPGVQSDAAGARLLAALGSLTDPLILVVDDLHELRSPEALAWLEQLVIHLPPRLRLVLVTREDPRLGLHRLRLSGALTEIRGPDLRFSLEETRELLCAEGISLSDRGVALIHERTEGWAAGLRLAVISLARTNDPERFVQEFSGSERTVAGYLLAEVLERQPAEVRELLLRTSILDRVSGDLADFLTGGSGAECVLQQLEDENAFVTSLDASRSWFRYHHLFAELLQLELRRVAPVSVIPLHRAAAQWFELNGCVIEAVQHAQIARDWPLALRLLSTHYFDLTVDGRIATVRELLSGFPDDIAADPELMLAFSAVRLLEGELGESAAYLESAEQNAEAVTAERRARFDAHLAATKLALARWRGDLDAVLDANRELEAALTALPPGERALSDSHRSVALQNLGIAELWAFRFDDGQLHLEQALAIARRAGYQWLEISPLAHLAILNALSGRSLIDALSQNEEALRIAEAHHWRDDPIIVTALATGAIALLWLGRFGDAANRLERAERVMQAGGEPGTELIVHYARGVLCLVGHEPQQALSAFEDSERMQALLAREHALTVELRCRMVQTLIALGRAADARATRDAGGDDKRNWAEWRVADGAILLAEGCPDETVETLVGVIEGSVPSGHPVLPAIEASLLDAVAREQLRDHSGAEQSIERALTLAEPNGYILPFVLAPAGELLRRHPRHRTGHATLLRTVLAALAGAEAPARGEPAALAEPLSETELRVVRYLPSNLKAPEIAAELFVSTNTVRTHIRHIYAKLGAHDRGSAVTRARELGLIAPSLRSR